MWASLPAAPLASPFNWTSSSGLLPPISVDSPPFSFSFNVSSVLPLDWAFGGPFFAPTGPPPVAAQAGPSPFSASGVVPASPPPPPPAVSSSVDLGAALVAALWGAAATTCGVVGCLADSCAVDATGGVLQYCVACSTGYANASNGACQPLTIPLGVVSFTVAQSSGQWAPFNYVCSVGTYVSASAAAMGTDWQCSPCPSGCAACTGTAANQCLSSLPTALPAPQNASVASSLSPSPPPVVTSQS